MLRRRSIRMRIIVLVLVPVIALIGLYATILALTLGSVASLREAASVRDQVTKPLTNAQLQLSAERAFALQYLAKPNHVRLLAFLGQEPRTDTAVRRFDAAAAAAKPKSTAGEIRALDAIGRRLSGLRDLRGTVVSLGLSRAEAAAAYGEIIAGGNNVIIQAILPLLDTPGAVQANNLVVMEESLQAAAEERDLFSSDLAAHSYPGPDRRLINQLIVSRKQTLNQAMASLDQTYRKFFSSDVSANTSATLNGFENQILAGPHSAMQIPPDAWMAAGNTYSHSFKHALTQAAQLIRDESVAKARSLVLRLILAGGLGLLAIAAALTFAVLISRALLRQFNEVRSSALELSSVQLPAVLARLRSGAEVDLAIEAPQLEADSSEIGQLREAINLAAQAAISAAVDEVAMRRGVNDVFRNLARRNQSLLTRQLELLDAMERRVHDPEELADLFRVDHLTTRMRRHAEGLLIVAGGSSGRSWRNPVPIVDVMRAAIAEVEDYTRIRVSSRSIASIAGHAVADVIHLLAELVENATTFSPANTPVRIESDLVGKGLVIEIEDRGLGMGDDLLAEVNARLSNPQPLDLSGSEQLGLYIAGQLARRHEVKITMQGSAYGGVTAVVLLPNALVAEPGLDPSGLIGIRELGGRPVPQLPGPAQPEAAMTAGSHVVDDFGSPGYLVDLETAATAVTTTAAHIGTGPLTTDPLEPLDPGPVLTLGTVTEIDQTGPIFTSGNPGAQLSATTDANVQGSSSGWLSLPGDQDGSDDRPPTLDEQLSAFDDLPRRPASTLPSRPAQPPNLAFDPSEIFGPGGGAASFDGFSLRQSELEGLDELPIRVRQANIAPQLREPTIPAQASQFIAAPEMPASPAPSQAPAGEPSPEAARSTMAALQRGWERGRSMAEQMSDEPDGDPQ